MEKKVLNQKQENYEKKISLVQAINNKDSGPTTYKASMKVKRQKY